MGFRPVNSRPLFPSVASFAAVLNVAIAPVETLASAAPPSPAEPSVGGAEIKSRGAGAAPLEPLAARWHHRGEDPLWSSAASTNSKVWRRRMRRRAPTPPVNFPPAGRCWHTRSFSRIYWFLRRVAGPAMELLIETISSETASYVVTEAREGFRNLREWLEQAAGEPLPVPKGAGDDRFTRVGAWRVPGSVPSKPVSAEPAPSSASGIFSMPPPSVLPEPELQPAAAPPPPPPPAELGEFTRMFQAARPASPPPTPQASPSPAAAQPGAFTQMFHSQAPASAPPALPVTPFPKPAVEESGEFTRFFQSPLSSKPMEVNPPPSAPVPPPAPAAPPPGEYTRLFQTPAPPSAPVSGRGATQVFVTPSAAPPPETLMQQGPSDFTRIIQAGASPSFEARPVEPAPAAAGQARVSRLAHRPDCESGDAGGYTGPGPRLETPLT